MFNCCLCNSFFTFPTTLKEHTKGKRQGFYVGCTLPQFNRQKMLLRLFAFASIVT
ncbi:MAG: hypothetical protein H0U49_08025 [Parachlamydiaceae bacterium]|nr:hypothetical protein [Parachlamydiaceae bacterium]